MRPHIASAQAKSTAMPSLHGDSPHDDSLHGDSPHGDSAGRRTLEARSVALVGVSRRPGSLGERAHIVLERSPGKPTLRLVNPRDSGEPVGEHPVVASLDILRGPSTS